MYDNNDEIANAEDEDIKPEHIGVIWLFFFQRSLFPYNHGFLADFAENTYLVKNGTLRVLVV